MLCCRRISVIGTPASPCFRMLTIWLSVNRDFRMGISLAPESLPSNCLPGGEAYGRTDQAGCHTKRANVAKGLSSDLSLRHHYTQRDKHSSRRDPATDRNPKQHPSQHGASKKYEIKTTQDKRQRPQVV